MFHVVFWQVRLGNRDHLSPIDIQQMNLLYKCSGGGGGGGGGGPNPPPPPPPTGLITLLNDVLHYPL